MDLKEDRKERQQQIDAALGDSRLHHRMEWICMISGPSIMNRSITNFAVSGIVEVSVNKIAL